jgi:hypothetical protein
MVMEILALVGNLPIAGCVVLSKAWEKKIPQMHGYFYH